MVKEGPLCARALAVTLRDGSVSCLPLGLLMLLAWACSLLHARSVLRLPAYFILPGYLLHTPWLPTQYSLATYPMLPHYLRNTPSLPTKYTLATYLLLPRYLLNTPWLATCYSLVTYFFSPAYPVA
eukprot:6197559-Pleurochrysis_carterae.AAC.2